MRLQERVLNFAHQLFFLRTDAQVSGIDVFLHYQRLILHWFYVIGATAFLVLMPGPLIFLFQIADFPIFWFVLFNIVVFFVSMLLPKVSFKLRSLTIVYIFFSFGVFYILQRGMLGSGFLWLFVVPILCIALIDRRTGVFFLLLDCSIVLTIAVLQDLRIFTWYFDSWKFYLLVLNFCALSILVTTLMALLITGLKKLLSDLDRLNIDLRDTNDQRSAAESRVNYYRNYNPLTQLPNRASFMIQLDAALVQARTLGTSLAMITLDLDRFAWIGMTRGSRVADRVLVDLGNLLHRRKRNGDLVAHTNSDDFAVVLSGTTAAADVRAWLGSIHTALTKLSGKDSVYPSLTCSVGVSFFPSDGSNADELVKNSEAALARAKLKGKESLVFYDQRVHQDAMERFNLEDQISRGIDEGSFLAWYQAQVDKDGKIYGAEALVRWKTASGIVAPLHFIETAERMGSIIQIGEQVLRQACMDYKRWQIAGLQPGKISVNLSPFQFNSPFLVASIEKIIQDIDFDTKNLTLEITESGIMEDASKALDKLNAISAMGISIAIDDFGTGYSSIAKLKDFPVDCLKIDRSFITTLPADTKTLTITKAVIDLGRNLGFKLVAEGVERLDQVELLANLGCDLFQGFYFARPCPAADFELLLKKRMES